MGSSLWTPSTQVGGLNSPPKSVTRTRHFLQTGKSFQDKLKELSLIASPEQEERLVREVALYSDRIDTTEEITRAHSHLKQMRELLSTESTQEGHSAGNLFNFLPQELQREFNTLGSKSADGEISQRVVLCKAEIERIREQVQNVE